MLVGCHGLGTDMTVIIEYRHLSRVIIVQVLSHRGVEHEILTHKLLHSESYFLQMQTYIKKSDYRTGKRKKMQEDMRRRAGRQT